MEGELVIPQLFYKLLFFIVFIFVQPYVSNNAKPSGAKIKTGGGWQRTVPGWHRVNLFPPFFFGACSKVYSYEKTPLTHTAPINLKC